MIMALVKVIEQSELVIGFTEEDDASLLVHWNFSKWLQSKCRAKIENKIDRSLRGHSISDSYYYLHS